MNEDPRIEELHALAAEEGFTLPYPAEMIAALEDTGATVNLDTGEIDVGGASREYRWELTEAGQRLARLLAADDWP